MLLFQCVFALILLPLLTQGLKCHECADLKGRNNNTCVEKFRRVVEGKAGSHCRSMVFGGRVVGQGMVAGVLCSPQAITMVKMKIRY